MLLRYALLLLLSSLSGLNQHEDFDDDAGKYEEVSSGLVFSLSLSIKNCLSDDFMDVGNILLHVENN